MAGAIEKDAEALVMDARDHVATAIKDLQPSAVITYQIQGQSFQLTVMEAIPFGHKVAITDIKSGSEVRKYGEVIGRASADIAAGYHVHVHNVEGIRGRGDQTKEEKETKRVKQQGQTLTSGEGQ